MPLVNEVVRNFVGGELCPSVSARSDIKVYANGCERLENFLLETTGPVKYRTGTVFVNPTRRNALARFIPFQFSDSQSYLIECTPGYFRFYKDNGIIVDSREKTITGITAASPAVVTSNSHGFVNDEIVYISGIKGTISEVITDGYYKVKSVQTNTFALYSLDDTAIDTTDKEYKSDGSIEKTITGITAASPAVVTIKNHGLKNEDEVFINDVVGMETLNSKSFIVKNVTTDTFELYNDEDEAIDTTSLLYISGGRISKIVEIETPYKDVEGLTDEDIMSYLHKIQYTQNTDTAYIVHNQYEPRKLTRSSHTDWSFAEFERTSDYMTEKGKYPSSVAFDGAGRIIYAGFENEPDLILMSRGPDEEDGTPRYDDFTTGTLANDAIKMYLASMNGKSTIIKWLAANNRYFIVGTEGGLLRIVSSDGSDTAFSAESVPMARPIDSSGCANIRPVPKGNLLFYLQKEGLILRGLEYDLVYDSYKSVDKNLVSDRITSGGCREIVFQQGRPDIFWIPKKNGQLIGLTYHETEDVAGWHRTILGGSGKVISAGIMPRANNYDQLWLVVERVINGKTKRYVEYVSDYIEFVTEEDFYTDELTKNEDKERYQNDLYERQKLEKHLDCCMSYDGSQLGVSLNATITIQKISRSENNLAYFNSDVDIFNDNDLDRQIWRLHKEGIGSGRAKIVEFINAKQVKCKILKEFDIDTMAPGIWTLTTANISGLEHLEGETVSVVADGAVHPDCVVENGAIELRTQADVIHIGYGYRGMIKTMNLNVGGTTGSAQNKARNVYKVVFEFLNSLGVKFGTGLYNLNKLDFRDIDSKTNRPTALFSGEKSQVYDDKTQKRKHVYVVQDSPLPCTIQALDIYMEVVDD